MSDKKIDWTEAEEIAAAILKIKADDDSDSDLIETCLADKYNISFDDFHEIVDKLFSLITINASPLTDEISIGFGNKGVWLAKKDFQSQFISVVKDWMLGDKDLEESKSKGFSRLILKDGKVEFEIQILKPNNNNPEPLTGNIKRTI